MLPRSLRRKERQQLLLLLRRRVLNHPWGESLGRKTKESSRELAVLSLLRYQSVNIQTMERLKWFSQTVWGASAVWPARGILIGEKRKSKYRLLEGINAIQS